MTFHPDVLTDLVILYHAGEASQATRELLEKEALHNPAVAAALAARPRVMHPIDAQPVIREREVLERVRRHYLYRALVAVCIALLLMALLAVTRTNRPIPGPGHGSSAAPSQTENGRAEPR
jgi:hypothetical protein